MTFQKGHAGFPKKPTAQTTDLDHIKTMLGTLTNVVSTVVEQNKALAVRLAAVEQGKETFAATVSDNDAADVKSLRKTNPVPDAGELLGAGGAMVGLLGNMPVGSDGNELPEDLLRLRGPRFKSGSRVRLNVKACHDTGGKTWDEIIGSMRRQPELVGDVLRIQRFSTPHQVWKYAVVFKGLTTANGDGFRENELVPA